RDPRDMRPFRGAPLPPHEGNGDPSALLLLVPAVLFACADYRFSIGGKGVLTISAFELFAYLLLPSVVWARIKSRASSHLPAQTETRFLLWYVAWVLVAALCRHVTTIEVGEGVQVVSSAYPYQMDLKALVPAAVTFLALESFVR